MLSATFSFISPDFDFTLSELTSQKLSSEYLYQIAGLAIACEVYGILILNYCV
jgi:hypothetical protein